MGTLDDAIREHLELKRKAGASEEDLELNEAASLGNEGLPAETSSGPVPQSKQPLRETAEDETRAPGSGARASRPEDHDEAGLEEDPEELPWQAADLEEPEPDEVLPEEALDSHALPAEEPLEPAAGVEPESRRRSNDDQAEGSEAEDDVLEETPEFLEETPEHDRLWFEQRPPKDFDFGD